MVMDPNGPLIGYAWFEQLEAENARLKAEVERLTERNKFLEQIDSYLQGANQNAYEKRCDELEAELERLRKDTSMMLSVYSKHYERLRKAGDVMAKNLDWTDAYAVKESIEAEKAWNAAKEGKPS